MIKAINRVPLTRLEMLEAHSAQVSPIKRSIKISNQKFPADFFAREEKLLQSKMVNKRNPQTQQEGRVSMANSFPRRR